MTTLGVTREVASFQQIKTQVSDSGPLGRLVLQFIEIDFGFAFTNYR